MSDDFEEMGQQLAAGRGKPAAKRKKPRLIAENQRGSLCDEPRQAI